MSIQNEINRIGTNVIDAYNAVAKLGGLVPDTSSSDYLAESILSIGHYSNPNILDNWYFPDPINQLNILSDVYWDEYQLGIDRWRAFGENTTKWIENEGVHLVIGENSIVEQNIEWNRLPNKGEDVTVTVSALTDAGLLAATFVTSPGGPNLRENIVGNYGSFTFELIQSSGSVLLVRFWNVHYANDLLIKAVKLELGARQTLSYQNMDGDWVLNDPPPNKGLELAKCQRYQMVYVYGGTIVGTALFYSSTSAYYSIFLPVDMRASPVIPLGKIVAIRGQYTYEGIHPNLIRSALVSPGLISGIMEFSTEFTVGAHYPLGVYPANVESPMVINANI